MTTTTLSIDAGIAPVGEAPAGVPMATTLAENAQDGAAFQEAVAKFQAAMAAPQGVVEGVKGLEIEVVKIAGDAVPEAAGEKPFNPITLKSFDSAPALATVETLKAVVAENARIAAELPQPAEVPATTAKKVAPSTSEAGGLETVAPQATETQILQTVPMVVPAESAAVQQVVADVKVAAVDAASARTQILVDTVEAVCDAILVTPGLVRGEGEMLIRLRPDVLSGTEIQLEAKGQTLTVAFIPATTEVSTLIARNLSQFEQHLAGRIHNYQITAKFRNNELKG